MPLVICYILSDAVFLARVVDLVPGQSVAVNEVLEHEKRVIDNRRDVPEILNDGVNEVIVGCKRRCDESLQVGLIGDVEIGGSLEDGMKVEDKERLSHQL